MKKWMLSREGAVNGCLVLMLVFGILFSFMVPPWQTPDEYAHVRLIGEGLNNPRLGEVLQEDMDLDGGRISFQYDEKMDVEQWRDAMTKAPGYRWQEAAPGGIRVSVLKHLPAALGMTLGVLLRLPTFWVMELGELFALVFYLVICWTALKLMPMKKEVLLMLMAFPMSLHQAASLSYDAVLLPACFLFVAYIFHMRLTKERLGWRDAALTAALLLFIAYIKLPYLFLGLLVFLLPREKIHLKIGRFEIDGEVLRRYRVLLTAALLVLLAAGLYAVRDNYWVRLVEGMVLEWKRTLYLFRATEQQWRDFLIVSSVGEFGWLDSALPLSFAVGSYLLVLAFAVWGREREKACALKGRTMVFLWAVFLLLTCLTVMSMVNHTVTITLYGEETTEIAYNIREALYQIPYIGGLQGRYFLPFLALPFLGLPKAGKDREWKAWLVAGYLAAAMALTVRVLYLRYWG